MIAPLLAEVSTSTLAVSIAGPVTVTSLLATLIVVILPPNLTAVAAFRATDSTSVPMVPPITIVPPTVPLVPPAVIVTVSLEVPPLSTPMTFPVMVIVSFDVEATRSKSPVIFRPSVPPPWLG